MTMEFGKIWSIDGPYLPSALRTVGFIFLHPNKEISVLPAKFTPLNIKPVDPGAYPNLKTADFFGNIPCNSAGSIAATKNVAYEVGTTISTTTTFTKTFGTELTNNWKISTTLTKGIKDVQSGSITLEYSGGYKQSTSTTNTQTTTTTTSAKASTTQTVNLQCPAVPGGYSRPIPCTYKTGVDVAVQFQNSVFESSAVVSCLSLHLMPGLIYFDCRSTQCQYTSVFNNFHCLSIPQYTLISGAKLYFPISGIASGTFLTENIDVLSSQCGGIFQTSKACNQPIGTVIKCGSPKATEGVFVIELAQSFNVSAPIVQYSSEQYQALGSPDPDLFIDTCQEIAQACPNARLLPPRSRKLLKM